MSKHDLAKLENFSRVDVVGDQNETFTEKFTIAQIHDVTDILKNMLIRVETNRILSRGEKFIQFFQSIDIANSALFRWLMGISAILVSQLVWLGLDSH